MHISEGYCTILFLYRPQRYVLPAKQTQHKRQSSTRGSGRLTEGFNTAPPMNAIRKHEQNTAKQSPTKPRVP